MLQNDPNTPPADGTCYLLGMPKELRDIITEYALTFPENLYYSKKPDSSPKVYCDYTATFEANQLKYTCRQLYCETAGQEVKFNTIKFVDDSDSNKQYSDLYEVIGECTEFLYSCSPTAKDWIRDIIIQDRDSEDVDPRENWAGISDIMEFCMDNPKAYITFYWGFPHMEKILRMLYIKFYLLCQDRTDLDILGEDEATAAFWESVLDVVKSLKNDLPNLVFRAGAPGDAVPPTQTVRAEIAHEFHVYCDRNGVCFCDEFLDQFCDYFLNGI